MGTRLRSCLNCFRPLSSPDIERVELFCRESVSAARAFSSAAHYGVSLVFYSIQHSCARVSALRTFQTAHRLSLPALARADLAARRLACSLILFMYAAEASAVAVSDLLLILCIASCFLFSGVRWLHRHIPDHETWFSHLRQHSAQTLLPCFLQVGPQCLQVLSVAPHTGQ